MEAIDIAEKQKEEQIEFENQLIKKVKLEDSKKPQNVLLGNLSIAEYVLQCLTKVK